MISLTRHLMRNDHLFLSFSQWLIVSCHVAPFLLFLVSLYLVVTGSLDEITSFDREVWMEPVGVPFLVGQNDVFVTFYVFLMIIVWLGSSSILMILTSLSDSFVVFVIIIKFNYEKEAVIVTNSWFEFHFIFKWNRLNN